MEIVYPTGHRLGEHLRNAGNGALDFIVLITGAFERVSLGDLKGHLDECVRSLKEGGLLFVQGLPQYLSELGVFLDQRLRFKYWIAVESTLQPRDWGLPSAHAGILLFTKGERFSVRQTRFPHRYCSFCGNPLRDWGGKKHLMHPGGHVISDVWTELPKADNYTQISERALATILAMVGREADVPPGSGLLPSPPHPAEGGNIRGLVGPEEGVARFRQPIMAESAHQLLLPSVSPPDSETSGEMGQLGESLFDVVVRGDAVQVLRKYPDKSVDLVFADPPYNLEKQYARYRDERDERHYIEWCNSWLKEYARILKPTGCLYVLNLPRWTMYHAAFLNQHLHFQNWIVWDALSEPRGKLMPAHYGLLFYTKQPKGFTFNYEEVGRIDARSYCLRGSCIRRRKAAGADEKEPLTDIWWDVHRIKHKRDRDYHPCQLPEELMERIIRLSTNEGDIVLDAMCGTGTTAVTAVKLGRRYVAIDLDETYVRLTREKIREVERFGEVRRKSIYKPVRECTKKELQLELRHLAQRLGRLPTQRDVEQLSQYAPDVFLDLFPTWGKALKAAKLVVHSV
ncbi:MAG: site-specific DNA-methyltransferase [Planctomycetes bacterium]|nr:site-specific DNA-methyltransferase [Planctomycetota bacterium]